MPTNQDYLNQGYTQQQIQNAIQKKNTANMSTGYDINGSANSQTPTFGL